MRKLIAVAICIALLVFGAWLYLCPILKSFPKPTGPYTIGTTSLECVDQHRIDPYSPNHEKRTVMLRIWYPSHVRGEKYPYIGNKMAEFQKIFAHHDNMPLFISRLLWRNTMTNAFSNVPLAPDRQQYPVVLFCHGLFGLPADCYVSIIETIASNGYIVVGIDQPYFNILTKYPDGRIVNCNDVSAQFENMRPTEQNEFLSKAIDIYKADMKFVIDELKKLNADVSSLFYGHLDLNNIGVMGHSAGGTAALELCRSDDRCKVAIDLDGWYDHVIGQEPLRKPALLLFGSKSIEVSEPTQDYLQRKEITREQYYEREHTIAEHKKELCKESTCSMIIIPGADHGDFSDAILFKWPLRAWSSQNAYSILRKINGHIIQFLETYLK